MSGLNTIEGDFSLMKLSDACVLVVRRLPANSHFQGVGGHFPSWGRKGQFKGRPVEPAWGLV